MAQEAMIAAYRRWDDVAAYEHPGARVRKVCANLSAGRTAEELAGWLAARPYLRRTAASRTLVADLPAYAVDVELRPGAEATATCQPDIADCVPMVLLPFGDNATGIAHGQVGRMVFVDLPGGTTALVYLWDGGGATAGDLAAIVDELQPVVDSIRFEPTG